jgi:thiamine biosynthesis lipoprotein ApbE
VKSIQLEVAREVMRTQTDEQSAEFMRVVTTKDTINKVQMAQLETSIERINDKVNRLENQTSTRKN